MSEGQKKRNIGRGMKPRGNQQVKSRKGSRDVTTQSTTEGQGTPAPEAVLEGQEGNSKGGNLDLETAASGLQNLESNGGEKGPNPASDDALEAAMKESQDGAEKDGVRCTTDEPVDLETAMAVGTGKVSELKRPTIDQLEELIHRHGAEGVSLEPDGTVKLAIGLQPDGSLKVVVTVQEGQVEMVKAYAESDGTGGVSVEKWLSDRIFEFIEAYSGRA